MSQNLNLLRQKYCRPATFTGKRTDHLFPLGGALGRKPQNMLASLWSDWFSTLVFAGRLRFGDAFPLAFEHHFAFKLSDPAQHGHH